MAAMNGPSPLLDLPREIRDQIYCELLTPTISTQDHDSYGLEPAILRANRQVHQEASEVLYSESCWILFVIPGGAEFGRNPSYTETPAIPLRNGESCFGGLIIAPIEITIYSTKYGNDPKRMTRMIASAYDLQRTFDSLMRGLLPRHFQLAIDVRDSFQKYSQHHERLLQYLRGVRGFARAVVQASQLHYSDKEIVRQMMTPHKCFGESIESLRTYQRRGDGQVALGKHVEAGMIYKDGLSEYWHYDCEIPTQAQLSDWDNQFTVLRTASAFCNMKVGYITEARSEISLVLDEPSVQDAQKATALYVQGLIFLAEDSYTDASVVFRQALMFRPGYEAVIQEVDKMEAKIQTLKGKDNTF